VKQKTAIDLMLEGLASAQHKHPLWPENVYEQIAVITEELGELSQAVLQHEHEGGDYQRIVYEAVQVAAMGMRFLKNLDTPESKKRKTSSTEELDLGGM
jgi:NTP pyrophosphatase (non-canonical NTP hydrolase)